MKRETHLEREYSKLWCRNYKGTVVAIQYYHSDIFGDMPDPDNRPIYVGFEGHQPEDLSNVLTERDELREKLIKQENKRIDSLDQINIWLENKINKIEERLDNKKWWQFWK